MDNSGFLLSSLFTTHMGKSGGRGLSPRLWSRIATQAMSPDGGSNGVFVTDDFLNFSGYVPAISGAVAVPVAASPFSPNGYGFYVDTAVSACSVGNLATESFGVARLLTSATDNYEAWIAGQGNTGNLGMISDTPADARLTIFEARVRFNQVSNDGGAIFVGLAEAGTAANSAKIDDTGVMSDRDFIGFNTIQSAGNLLSINFRRAGQAQQAVGSGTTIVASTWYKLGFIYDPKAVNSEKIKFFINNVELADKVTATNIATNTFPDGERLAFLAGIKNGSAAATSMDIDWWAYHQSVDN